MKNGDTFRFFENCMTGADPDAWKLWEATQKLRNMSTAVGSFGM